MTHKAEAFELREIIRTYIPLGTWDCHRAQEIALWMENEIDRLLQEEVRRLGT